jgi:hypothetical protein
VRCTRYFGVPIAGPCTRTPRFASTRPGTAFSPLLSLQPTGLVLFRNRSVQRRRSRVTRSRQGGGSGCDHGSLRRFWSALARINGSSDRAILSPGAVDQPLIWPNGSIALIAAPQAASLLSAVGGSPEPIAIEPGTCGRPSWWPCTLSSASSAFRPSRSSLVPLHAPRRTRPGDSVRSVLGTALAKPPAVCTVGADHPGPGRTGSRAQFQQRRPQRSGQHAPCAPWCKDKHMFATPEGGERWAPSLPSDHAKD